VDDVDAESRDLTAVKQAVPGEQQPLVPRAMATFAELRPHRPYRPTTRSRSRRAADHATVGGRQVPTSCHESRLDRQSRVATAGSDASA
jgi:hypothetical protein